MTNEAQEFGWGSPSGTNPWQEYNSTCVTGLTHIKWMISHTHTHYLIHLYMISCIFVDLITYILTSILNVHIYHSVDWYIKCVDISSCLLDMLIVSDFILTAIGICIELIVLALKLPYLTVYKMHWCIRHTPISAGQIKETF